MIGDMLRRIVAATSCAGLLTAGLLVGAGPASADAATGSTEVGYPITWANYTVNAVGGDGTPLRVKLADAMGSDGSAVPSGAATEASMVLTPGTDGIHDPVASSLYIGQTSADPDCPDDESYWYTDERSQRVTQDCWLSGMNPGTGSGPFGVIVPLVAHEGADLVVFDHWATGHVTAGCDTGFSGARDPYFGPNFTLLAGTLYGLDKPPTYGAPDDSSSGPADRYDSPGRGATFLSWYDAAGPATASQSQDGQRFTATAVYAPASPDTSKPIPTIETPMDCANYVQGETYPASYDCVDPGQSAPMPASQCVGTAAAGAALDTTTLGKHTFTVTGTDAAGNSRSRTVTYNVVPPNSATAQSQEIRWQSSEPQDATYGGSYTPAATAPGGVVRYSVDPRTADVCTLDQGTLEFTGVGTCVLYGNQAGGTDYKAAPQAVQTIRVRPAPVTIAADDQSMTYGGAQPTYTYSASGLVTGDDLATKPICGSTRTPGSVGTYDIVCSGAEDPNYTFSYDSGTLRVDPAPVTITAKSVSITYGDQPPAAYDYTTSGLVGGDTLTADPTCQVADPHSDAGSYAITCTGAAAGPDYTVGYAPGTLRVTPAPVTVTADNTTKVYGSPDPEKFGATVTGLLGGDTLSTQPQCAVASVHVDAGEYPIRCSAADAGDNYVIAYQDGTLTITTAPLMVTADSKSILYGDPDPAFTATTTGLVGGDRLVSAPTCGLAGSYDAVGTYPISCTGADAGQNYTVTYLDGTLTVAKGKGVVTPSDQTITYGEKDPVFDYTVSGLKAGDSLVAAPTCGVSGPHTDAGTYPITCSGGDAGANYDLDETATGTLTVLPKPVTVSADNQIITYGEADPDFTFQTAGLVLGDTLTAAPICDVSTQHSDAGNYQISCTGGDAGSNYTISFQPGTLTVEKATLTFTGINATRAYGETNPPLTASPSGLVNGDTVATAYTGTPVVSTPADPTSHVGSYPIEVSTGTLTSKNYTFDFVPGTLTVTQAATTLIGGALVTANQGDAASVDMSHVQASLTNVNADTPVAGQTITFTVAGQSLCTAVTDATGTAICLITHDQMTEIVRNGGYLATFLGTADLGGATGNGDFVRHDAART